MSRNLLHQPDLHRHLSTLADAWQGALRTDAVAEALARLTAMLTTRLAAGALIYPEEPFRALQALAPSDIKVVILGQDPYHGPGQAQGLAFSVPDTLARPPSLRNIFLEIAREYQELSVGEQEGPAPGSRMTPGKMGSPAQGRLDIGPAPAGNDLSRWASQGVLLLNTVLTVEDGKPASHAKSGWETVTDAIISLVARDPAPKVFMLWGAHAQAKRDLIHAQGKHLILTSNHPSPLSARRPPAPFLGCGHFLQANVWLSQQNRQVIDWKT